MTPEAFMEHLNDLVAGWVTEFRFYPGRRCAFDYANPQQLAPQGFSLPPPIVRLVLPLVAAIAIEIEGGCWLSQAGKKSRHFTGSGAQADMRKYNAAQRRGWTLFRYADSNKNISLKTLEAARRDLKVWLTGIEDGQQTLTTKQRTVAEML